MKALASGSSWLMLGRHQVASAVATVVDFTTMVLLVERAGVHAAWATVMGAALGAVVNFFLGRVWVFRGTARNALAPEALRYAVVSGTSALLNGLGEHILHGIAGVAYLPARAVVAVGISLFWNFPMQRGFVFQHGAR